jgi:hypothetical protein
VRLIRLPLTIDVISTPAISGVNWRPEIVGLWPLTICRKRGRYVTEPKSAKPTMKPTMLVTRKTLFRNRSSGRIGSGARRSTRERDEQHHRDDHHPDDLGEPQAYVVPPGP